ncbi:glycosyltransferase family 4 protein [Streptococcus uberis]|uniref:glycosyltransferase family 4 protein n=1 Tax=Streptococcus uberis TaxID=1349 RepID=UPI001FF547F9|nr:glycosyltransferase family 4 protein [Streptococcus uberis]MCK1191806.1 glycosyltransferase family 4 protein [Streptococcus uberis]MCK1239235.1 glycosyltransferase family 4 protein [Streptococcus uberis]
MKIAIVTTGTNGLPVPPAKGGAVENLIDTYLKHNEKVFRDDITVFSCEDGKAKLNSSKYKYTNFVFLKTSGWAYKINKIVRYVVNKFSKKYVGNAFISQLPDLSNFDVVLIENRLEYGYYLKDKISGKLILHMHNDVNLEDYNFNLEEEIYDLTICVSEYIKEQIKLKLNFKNLFVIYNGIKNTRFENYYSEEDIKHFRKSIGINNKDKVILFSGRLNKNKGIRELLEAFLKLPVNKNYKLLVMGNSIYGLNSKDQFTKDLYNMAASRKNDIIFTGYVNYEDVPLIYHSCDLVVLPSIWEEPLGLTIIEAVASGKPLITTNSGGIPEIVKGTSAIVLDRDDLLVKNLTDSIEYIFENIKNRNFSSELDKSFTEESYCENLHLILKKNLGC